MKGFAEIDELARLLAMSLADVSERIASFERSGYVRHLAGDLAGWTLTAVGRVEDERLLAAELDAVGARDDVGRVYREFVPLNVRMLDVCSRWQVRSVGPTSVVNDHDDDDYDRAIVAELEQIDASVQPLCRRLGEHLERFESYGPRFTRALGSVERGRSDWFAKPGIDSYHSVWFELHEDLMSTLGVQRGEDRAAEVPRSGDAVSVTAEFRKEP